MPSQLAPPTPNFETAPERSPDRYGPNANSNQKKGSQLAVDFFKDSVKSVQERNQRYIGPQYAAVNTSDHLPYRQSEFEEKPENYTTLKVIGKGAFDEVKLVQKKGDGRVYAMKSLIKTEMFEKDQLAYVRSERDVLADSDCPWVVKLYSTFQDPYFLYMLMEFLPGGDLLTMLIKYEVFSEDITRFYMAELVLAIDAVHQLGYIHR